MPTVTPAGSGVREKNRLRRSSRDSSLKALS
jgi:hypothetical protein